MKNEGYIIKLYLGPNYLDDKRHSVAGEAVILTEVDKDGSRDLLPDDVDAVIQELRKMIATFEKQPQP